MFHARVRDGVSAKVTGMGDFADAESAAAECRHYLEHGAPSPGSEGFVQDDNSQIVYVATISAKGTVTGSWSEQKAKKVADELRETDEK